jgi:hypothetical protein
VNPDITWFDSCGILPSHSVRSVDEYLRESEAKLRTIEDVTGDPERYFGRGSSVFKPNAAARDYLLRKYETNPPSCLLVSTDIIIRAIEKRVTNPGRLIDLRWVKGTILEMNNMVFPLIDGAKFTNPDRASCTALHETIHAIRTQWKQTSKFSYLEEVICYGVGADIDLLNQGVTYAELNPDNNQLKYIGMDYSRFIIRSALPSLTRPCLLAGLTGLLMAQNPGVGIAAGAVAFLLLGANLMHDTYSDMRTVNKCQKLINAGGQEGLNMNYMILRTNPDEFNLKQPLIEQIAEKEGVRWDIIRNRYDIPKSE